MKLNQTKPKLFLQNLANQLRFLMCMLLLFSILSAKSQTPDPTITELFQNAYHTWELQRNSKGMYRDSKLFSGTDFHPASIANVGAGLISLCIADAMGWETNAAQLALTTLKTVNGHTSGFTPDRNTTGYFRHFMDMETGAQAWGSEYSTIDTDILALAAMFCKNYFSTNALISAQVDELWNSIDFTKAIANPNTGQIYLTMLANGEGGSNSTSVYNEYMLVAWCAINDLTHDKTNAKLLWNNFYATPNNLPKSNYAGIDVLTDNAGNFLSSFTHLFNYYLCNFFNTSNEYMSYFSNAYNADKKWWENNSSTAYAWGHGAGVDFTNYHADKINDNPDKIVSPHIIAGFLPINNNGKNDLLSQYNNNMGVYSLPDNTTKKVLWRYSLNNTNWKGNSVQGIDYSTFLYGLATLPEYLGINFFNTYNTINTVASKCNGYVIPGIIKASNYCGMYGVQGDPVGYIDANDWMTYNVNAANTGIYNLSIEFASPDGGDKFELFVDNISKGQIDVPSTGSWSHYSNLNTTINLSAGLHEIKVHAITGGYNLKQFDFKLNSNWTPISSSDFENGFGIWTDGGGDCKLYTGSTHAHQGNAAINIQDNSGINASFYSTNSINLTDLNHVKVAFWFKAVSMESGEDFLLEYYNGSTWVLVRSFIRGQDFENGEFVNTTVTLSKANYIFSNNAKFRFRCDASGNRDDVYIDEINIYGASSIEIPNTVSSTKFSQKTLKVETSKNTKIQPSNVSIYPNPVTSSSTLNIKLSNINGPSNIKIFDAFGRKVFEKLIKTNILEIKTNNLINGNIYFIKIENKNAVITKKIVVNLK